MQPVSGSFMLFLSCQHKKVYWISQKSNSLKGVTPGIIMVVLGLLFRFSIDYTCLITLLITAFYQQAIKWTLGLNIRTQMNKLSNKHSTWNARYNDKKKNNPGFLVKSMHNLFPKIHQKYAYMMIKDWKKWSFMKRMQKYFIITLNFCST